MERMQLAQECLIANFCQYGNEPKGSMKVGNSSHEGLCPIELLHNLKVIQQNYMNQNQEFHFVPLELQI